MTKLLNRTSDEWRHFQGLSTAEEISQQPKVWRELASLLAAQQAPIAAFLHGWLGQAGHRVILTGAGSSAFAGEAIAEEINRHWPAQVRAIATTSLITHPELYLERDQPTLLVSFARSGNSPESLAAVNLVRSQVAQARFVNITCNEAGALYAQGEGQADTLNLLMPAASCDRGFAMTSSFTCMQLAALAAFSREPWAVLAQRLETLATHAETLLSDWAARLAALAQITYERIVYLGSGPLEALAKEASLKVLELSSGRVAAFANTSLGFRHGPKSVLDKSTLVLLFLSNDKNARNYELDLLAELRRDQVAGRILAIGPGEPEDGNLFLPGVALNDSWLAPLWLLAAQQYALHRSVALGLTPDNPFPDGTVNRIVQGVTIYPYAAT